MLRPYIFGRSERSVRGSAVLGLGGFCRDGVHDAGRVDEGGAGIHGHGDTEGVGALLDRAATLIPDKFWPSVGPLAHLANGTGE